MVRTTSCASAERTMSGNRSVVTAKACQRKQQCTAGQNNCTGEAYYYEGGFASETRINTFRHKAWRGLNGSQQHLCLDSAVRPLGKHCRQPKYSVMNPAYDFSRLCYEFHSHSAIPYWIEDCMRSSSSFNTHSFRHVHIRVLICYLCMHDIRFQNVAYTHAVLTISC